MALIQKDPIARPGQSLETGLGEADEFFRVLGRTLAPMLLSAHTLKALAEISAKEGSVAPHILVELASRTEHLNTTAYRERRREYRDTPLETLPPELIRSRIFDTSEAAAFCGFSVAHWRRLYRTRKVPKPIQLSTRKLGWRAGDLIDWLQSRLDSS